MKVSCEWVRAHLARRSDDSRAGVAPLSEDEAYALDEHLVGCTSCREFAARASDDLVRESALTHDVDADRRAHEFLRRFFDVHDLREAGRLREADESSQPISAEDAASAPLEPGLRRDDSRRTGVRAAARRRLLDLLPRASLWRWATLTGAAAAVVLIAIVLTRNPGVDVRTLEFGREGQGGKLEVLSKGPQAASPSVPQAAHDAERSLPEFSPVLSPSPSPSPSPSDQAVTTAASDRGETTAGQTAAPPTAESPAAEPPAPPTTESMAAEPVTERVAAQSTAAPQVQPRVEQPAGQSAAAPTQSAAATPPPALIAEPVESHGYVVTSASSPGVSLAAEEKTSAPVSREDRSAPGRITVAPPGRMAIEAASSDNRMESLVATWERFCQVNDRSQRGVERSRSQHGAERSGPPRAMGGSGSQLEAETSTESSDLGRIATTLTPGAQRSLIEDQALAEPAQSETADSLQAALAALTGALREVAATESASAPESLSANDERGGVQLPPLERIWLAAGDGWFTLWQSRGDPRFAREAKSAYEHALAKSAAPAVSRGRDAARTRSADRPSSLGIDEVRRAEERIRSLRAVSPSDNPDE